MTQNVGREELITGTGINFFSPFDASENWSLHICFKWVAACLFVGHQAQTLHSVRKESVPTSATEGKTLLQKTTQTSKFILEKLTQILRSWGPTHF